MISCFHVRTGRLADAADLVERYHYSARVPANVQHVISWHEDGGLFGGDGPAVAACYFCIPPTQWNEPVLELSRLVRVPDCQAPLTSLIGQACKLIKAHGADLLVSYADFTQRHHGGIYQAASWNYDGLRGKACDGVLVDGVFVPGRSCNSKYGTRSPDRLRAILRGRNVEPHYDAGKHLYWRAVTKSGAAKASRLGLRSMPYPKPDAPACP